MKIHSLGTKLLASLSGLQGKAGKYGIVHGHSRCSETPIMLTIHQAQLLDA